MLGLHPVIQKQSPRSLTSKGAQCIGVGSNLQVKLHTLSVCEGNSSCRETREERRSLSGGLHAAGDQLGIIRFTKQSCA